LVCLVLKFKTTFWWPLMLRIEAISFFVFSKNI
jgi:hypothetical protein